MRYLLEENLGIMNLKTCQGHRHQSFQVHHN